MPGALAVNVRVTVAPTAASVGPGAKSMPGISTRSGWPAGSALVTRRVTTSPWATLSSGPGTEAVAVVQSPGVVGTPNPQTGIDVAGAVAGSGCSTPGRAHRSIVTGAATADAAGSGQAGGGQRRHEQRPGSGQRGCAHRHPSFRSCPLMARRRRSS